MSNNTIHQLTFAVKQHKETVLPSAENGFYFGDENDNFSNTIVF